MKGWIIIDYKLIGALIGLARATEGNEHLILPSTTTLVIECLSADHQSDEGETNRLLSRVEEEKRRMVPECYACTAPCGRNNAFEMNRLQMENPEIRNIKYNILNGISQLSKAHKEPCAEEESLLYRSLILIGIEDPSEKILRSYQTQIQNLLRNV